MTERRLALAVFVLVAAVPVTAHALLVWQGLAPGPHAVSFTTATVVDATRTVSGPVDRLGRPRPGYGVRPLHVAVWQPAVPGTGVAMTYADYLPELAWDTGPVPEGAAGRQADELRYTQTVTPLAGPADEPSLRRLLGEHVLARRDGRPADGRFPVLVYAPGMGYPAFDNSVLFEYLASHGWIVVSSPSIGPDAGRMTTDAFGLEAQARDLEVLVGHVQTLPQADADRIAVAGYSWGGIPAVWLALRNTRVRACVSLDGVVRDSSSLARAKGLLGFTPERLRVPLLVVTTSPERSIPSFVDESFLDAAKHAELTRAVVRGAEHHDLASMPGLLRRSSQPGLGRDWSGATAGYEALCRVMLAFLDSRVRGVESDLGRAAGAGCEVSTRAAVPAPPDPQEFLEVLGSDGPTRAAEVVRAAVKAHPGAVPAFEAAVNRAGYELLASGRGADAVTLFALAVEIAPASANASDSLGEAYLALGDLDNAERSYLDARRKLEQTTGLTAELRARAATSIEAALATIEARRAKQR